MEAGLDEEGVDEVERMYQSYYGIQTAE